MRQFLLGALCGATLTAFTMHGFGDRAAVNDDPPRVRAPQASPAIAPPTPAAPAAMAEVVPAPTTVLPPSAPSAPVPHGDATAPPARTPGPSPAVAVAPAPAERPAIPAPIRLSDEHAKMLAPRVPEGRPLTLPELHLQLSTEGKDPQWAAEMEQNLTRFIAQHNASGEFELLAVECRTTLCEILAFGNLPDSQQRWNLLGAEMSRQPWWSAFKGNSTSSSGQNGRTTIVTILQRAGR